MERKDFLAAFAAAPLAFVEQKDLDQKENTMVFLMNVDGETVGLGFKIDEFENDQLMNVFRALVRSAEQSFVEKIVFTRTV